MYNKINITQAIEQLERLIEQEQEAESNHADMELIGLYDNISELKKQILVSLISSYGSGTIASFIGNTKYQQIDRAVSKTMYFLFHAEPEELHDLQVDNAGIAALVKKCYMDKTIL